ncbi:hypothetical protein SH661x_004099 [Planctomicrobium sp. SH661]|uniref:hypothetical protein n=1 Tax=Planctomicrobium sp. SH661 TaxID=3448124 RepID=UPI003F5B2EF9
MLRIRQQYWFCLAAICLVGSLVMFWSTDIQVAEDATTPPVPTSKDSVFRRLGDLPVSATFSDPSQPAAIDPSGFDDSEPLLIAPAGVPGRMASLLNTTSRIVPREKVTPAGFQQTLASPAPEPVWLSGQIEILDPVR